MKIVKVTAGQMPGRKGLLLFGLMPVRKRVPLLLHSLGNTLTPRHQQHRYVNGKVSMDQLRPRKMLAELTIASQSALPTPNASTERRFASSDSNGSRPEISHRLLPPGIQQQTMPKERLKQVHKDRTMQSGQFYLAISPTAMFCSRQATSSIGLSFLERWQKLRAQVLSLLSSHNLVLPPFLTITRTTMVMLRPMLMLDILTLLPMRVKLILKACTMVMEYQCGLAKIPSLQPTSDQQYT